MYSHRPTDLVHQVALAGEGDGAGHLARGDHLMEDVVEGRRIVAGIGKCLMEGVLEGRQEGRFVDGFGKPFQYKLPPLAFLGPIFQPTNQPNTQPTNQPTNPPTQNNPPPQPLRPAPPGSPAA